MEQAKELLRVYFENVRTEPMEDEILPFESGAVEILREISDGRPGILLSRARELLNAAAEQALPKISGAFARQYFEGQGSSADDDDRAELSGSEVTSTTCFLVVDARTARLVPITSTPAECTLDAWRVAKFAQQSGGAKLDGRTWERTVSGLLYRPGFTRRQGPGCLTLFGSPSASGVNHEIDGAADGWRGTVIVESKAIGGGISKGDVALFHYKVMDYYQKKIAMASAENWWPTLCSATISGAHRRLKAVRIVSYQVKIRVCGDLAGSIDFDGADASLAEPVDAHAIVVRQGDLVEPMQHFLEALLVEDALKDAFLNA